MLFYVTAISLSQASFVSFHNFLWISSDFFLVIFVVSLKWLKQLLPKLAKCYFGIYSIETLPLLLLSLCFDQIAWSEFWQSIHLAIVLCFLTLFWLHIFSVITSKIKNKQKKKKTGSLRVFASSLPIHLCVHTIAHMHTHKTYVCVIIGFTDSWLIDHAISHMLHQILHAMTIVFQEFCLSLFLYIFSHKLFQ